MGFLSAIADWLAKLWNRLNRTLGRSNPRLEQSHVASWNPEDQSFLYPPLLESLTVHAGKTTGSRQPSNGSSSCSWESAAFVACSFRVIMRILTLSPTWSFAKP